MQLTGIRSHLPALTPLQTRVDVGDGVFVEATVYVP